MPKFTAKDAEIASLKAEIDRLTLAFAAKCEQCRNEYEEITRLHKALSRLTTVCDGANWLRHEGDALEQAHRALGTAAPGTPAPTPQKAFRAAQEECDIAREALDRAKDRMMAAFQALPTGAA